MNKPLKERAFGAVFWSFIDRAGQYGIQALVSVVLARLLQPAELGLIGMLWVFIAVAQILMDGGFGQALIQKQDATHGDESTIFYFNLITAFVGVGILWITAPWIGRFYNLPTLVPLARAISWTLPLAATGLVHATLLTKKLDLRTQAKAGFMAAILSGIVGVSMASLGFGVWSLVAQALTLNFAKTAALWFLHRWRPALCFQASTIREMLPFGIRLLSSGILDAIFRSLYPVTIGKLFSARDLGYFTTATRIPLLLSNSLTTIVSRVTLSVYPTLRDDPPRYRAALQKALVMMVAVNTPILLGIAAVAEPLVRVVLTDKWIPSIPYLQLYCIMLLLIPLHYANLEALLGLSRSDLYLRLELIKKGLSVVNILITFRWGIIGLLVGEIVACVISYVIQAIYVGRHVAYSLLAQVKDFLPAVLVSAAMALMVQLAHRVPTPSLALALIFQVVVGCVAFFTLSWRFRVSVYLELFQMVARYRHRFSAAAAAADESTERA